MSFSLAFDPATVPLGAAINHVVGTATTKLTNPGGARFLVLMADKGTWRLRKGDRVASGMPATALPVVSVTDGSGATALLEGGRIVMQVDMRDYTVRGYAADSVLTYTWL